MSKPREFKLSLGDMEKVNGLIHAVETSTSLGFELPQWHAVREISPEYDAIVAEMVEALEKLDAGYSGMFGHEGVTAEQDAYETGLDIVKKALAKYNFFMKGREG